VNLANIITEAVRYILDNLGAVAQFMAAIGTIFLACLAFRQLRYIKWEHSRRLALDAAVSASCILAIIKKHFQYFRPVLQRVCEEIYCPNLLPISTPPIEPSCNIDARDFYEDDFEQYYEALDDCVFYHRDKLASAIIAPKDKRASKLMPDLELIEKLARAIREYEQTPDEDRNEPDYVFS